MRRFEFSSLVLFLALLPFAFAQTTAVSIYTTTRTVYYVVTETHTGKAPSTLVNTTSTIRPSVGTILPSANITGTGAPTKVSPTTTAAFPGAAVPGFKVDTIVAALVAGVGLMVL